MVPVIVAQAWPFVLGIAAVLLLIVFVVIISFFNLWIQAYAAGARVSWGGAVAP